MIYIAHRGLFNGPDPARENHPDQIKEALDEGLHCEVDVWYVNGEWFLGHDEPSYPCSTLFLADTRLWVHCKNAEALQWCPNINRFWHQNDDYTFTRSGFIWTYPGKPLMHRSICVMPEWHFSPGFLPKGDYYGVCSDYVGQMNERFLSR